MSWPGSTHALYFATLCLFYCLESTGSDLASNRLWASHIEPILNDHCVKCHGPLKQKSGLDLSTFQSILKGGESGFVLVPGQPDTSRILELIRPGSEPHMPPKDQLSEEQIALFEIWIEGMVVLSSESHASDFAGNHAKESGSPMDPPHAESARIPPEGVSLPEAVDYWIEAGWMDREAKPSEWSDDRTFARRVYLDLIGRIPSSRELEAFLFDGGRDKRSRLVEALLSGEEYPVHMREIFDATLMGRRGDKWTLLREKHKWNRYLEDVFKRNRPWNEVVRELILARPETAESEGSVWFLYERMNDHQAMAEAVSPLIYGSRIDCAQCHDHPLAHEIKQAHYWGLVTAFNRSKNVETPGGLRLSESAVGGFVSFANLQKETQQASLRFLNGVLVEEARPVEGEKEQDSPELYRIPPDQEENQSRQAAVPIFSRREALADSVIEGSPLFAKAMVNRIWAHLMGRGLVHPVDRMDSKHPPSHPELLEWLAKDFMDSGYDVRRLIHQLTLTRVYQLDGHPNGIPVAQPDAFAFAIEKPIPAEALYRSTLIATGWMDVASGPMDRERAEALRDEFVSRFPDLFMETYHASLPQALFYSNSPILDQLLQPHPGNLISQMMDQGETTDRVVTAFREIYGRSPDSEELARVGSYLNARSQRPLAGVQQVVWALLSGAEFLLNH